MSNYIYSEKHFNFIDKIIKNRREKFYNFIKKKVDFRDVNSYLDIGTTQNENHPSSNYLNKKFDFIKIHNAISDQTIVDQRFKNILKKSITSDFSKEEIDLIKSDFIISNATIEHVGSFENQKKMIFNMINLTNNVMVIQTVNRYFPIETHTKLPLLHFLPKTKYRKLLKFLKYDYYSLEKNLNLLTYKDMSKLLNYFSNQIKFNVYKIYTFGFVSNILAICYKDKDQ